MGAIASQIISLTIVCSTVYSGAYQRKHQSPASLAFVRWIHRGPVNSPHKWPVTRKMFPFDYVIMRISDRVYEFLRLNIIWTNAVLLLMDHFGHSLWNWSQKKRIVKKMDLKISSAKGNHFVSAIRLNRTPLLATSPDVAGEFPTQKPVTRSFDVFFELCLNKRLSKHSWGWWFETPPRPLSRHCNRSVHPS